MRSERAALLYIVYQRVIDKLSTEPVEDFRIDFEDGYGNRTNEEEDGHAEQAANEVAIGMENNSLPPFIGIRVKSFSEELKARAIRTLDIFISTLTGKTNGKLPENFVVTLPKVTMPAQVESLIDLFEILEQRNNIPHGSLQAELMIETTQSIINHEGVFTIPQLVSVAKGRCRSCHFGTYDYTASCSVTAGYQSIQHKSCDFAKHIMQVTLSNTGVTISDGATTIMPIGPHRPKKEGPPLTTQQMKENQRAVHSSWRLSFQNIMYGFQNGFYQGWDLNPAQLPIRYAACYFFFLSSLKDASTRLKNFIQQAAQATLSGNAFDDAATGQGLLNYFIRALNCGAIREEELEKIGLTLEELQRKSFLQIVENQWKKK